VDTNAQADFQVVEFVQLKTGYIMDDNTQCPMVQ